MTADLFRDLKELLTFLRAVTEDEEAFREVRSGIGAVIALCASMSDVEYVGATEQQGALRFATRGKLVISIYPDSRGGAKVEVVPRAREISGFDRAGLIDRFLGGAAGAEMAEVCVVSADELSGVRLEHLESALHFAVAELTSY